MLLGIIYGVIGTLFVLFVVALLYPAASRQLLLALWDIRASNELVWAIFDTWLRQTDKRLGPKLNLTRQARRRISREIAKRLV